MKTGIGGMTKGCLGFLAAGAWLLFTGSPAAASGMGLGMAPKALALSAAQEPAACRAGEDCRLVVNVDLAEGMHIYGERPGDESFVASRLDLVLPDGMEAGAPTFPPPVKQKTSMSDKPLSIYEKDFKIDIPLKIASGIKPGKYPLEVGLFHQGCDGEVCLMPDTEKLVFDLVVK